MGVAGAQQDGLRGVVEDATVARQVALPHDGPQRLPLPRQVGVVLVAHGEPWVVDQHGARAREHDVGLTAAGVDVAARRGLLIQRDVPSAAALRPSREAADLPGHEGTSVLDRERPRSG